MRGVVALACKRVKSTYLACYVPGLAGINETHVQQKLCMGLVFCFKLTHRKTSGKEDSMQRFYDESMEAALQAVSSGRQGLTQAEARSRLEKNGKNKLAQPKRTAC